MCPMVGRLEWDMGDGLDSPHVSHGRKNMLEWDMGDGLDCPHVSHGRMVGHGEWFVSHVQD